MEKSRNVNYPGMFDLLKGIVLIGIILIHIRGLIPAEVWYEGELAPLKRAVYIFPETISLGNATMPLLLLISGYGFKAISLKKSVKKETAENSV